MPAPNTDPKSRGTGDGAALWSANGTLYVAGGTIDGSATTSVLWAAPSAATGVTKWTSVELSNLPADGARVGASSVVIGGHVLLLGGADATGAYGAGALSAATSPKAPVFRVGLFGLTVPGLALQGEVGQQIGFLLLAQPLGPDLLFLDERELALLLHVAHGALVVELLSVDPL